MSGPDLSSPLRYPGGKNHLTDYFENIIKENLLLGAPLYEPYAGGASISLAMLSRGLVSKATLVELDPLIYSFWKCVKECPEDLCRTVESVHVNLETWKKFQKYLDPDAHNRYMCLDLGLAGLFFNRTNFSGIINAGPIGGQGQRSQYKIDCRFNKARIIEQIQAIARYKSKLRVVHGDGLAFLKRHSTRIAADHGLVYVDPPYYVQGERLYRFNYQEQQHKELSNFIVAQKMCWVVSYDTHPAIRRMFAGQKIMPISFNYAVKQSRKVKELLISNIKLSQPVYIEPKGSESEKRIRQLRSG
jgi:DNA adenine methylase